MSLFWERAVSISPAAQVTDSTELIETADAQHINRGGNWESISIGSECSSQKYHWSQHNMNHSSSPTHSDPYGAAVMDTCRQRTHSLVNPYQQTSTQSCLQSTIPFGDVTQPSGVDQEQQHQLELRELSTSQAVLPEHVQHTLVPTTRNTQINHLPRAAEVAQDDTASHIQSKPAGFIAGFSNMICVTNGGSVAPSVNHNSIPRSNEVCIDAVRVASVPSSPTAVVGVPRYEENCRSQDHVPAVAQVAPLRPELDSVSSAQFSTQIPIAHTPVDEITEGTRNVVNAPTSLHSSQPTMVVGDNLSLSVASKREADEEPTEQVSISRVTPDIQTVDGSTLSPFVVKATSTPIDTEDSNVRAENQKNEGWEPRETVDGASSMANPRKALSVAENSDCTTVSLSMRNGPERRSVQSRYKIFKEHFSGIMGRLGQYRAEPLRSDLRSSSRTGNPLMANVSSSLGRRPVVTVAKNSAPHVRSVDGPLLLSVKAEGVEGNAPLFSQGGPSMNRSFELDPPAIYGDDFVDAARRSRRSRLSRPSSCTKSEFGENGLPHEQYDTGAYAVAPPPAYAGNYPSGRRSAHTSMGTTNTQDYYVQQAHMYKEQRRPRSSFDPRYMERFQRYGARYGNYDVYDEAHSSVSEEGISDEREDSEEEMRKYTQKGRYGGPAEAFDGQTVGEEMYYFGAIHLDQFRVRSILHHFPPPPEYYRLPPIEKAAYLFYVAVYKKRYNDIGDFHRKFNREYYKYTCEGDSDNIALWKICKSMQDEYHSKRLEESQKAYEATQRQLFSDERDSIDGMSERASVDDNHDDRTSDILSVDSTQRAPLKYRVPHAFVTFGYGGKVVTVHPDFSVSVVQIDDIKAVVTDPHSVKLIDSAQSFKGPLLIGQTPTHSVRLYIERQIKRIRTGELSSDNHRTNDMTDCLLIWQLLGVIVQQQGRVTGPDVARLLVEVSSTPYRTCSSMHQHYSYRERSVTPADSTSTSIGPVRNSTATDTRAYERFTELLLGGHIMEAIDSALRDGLYADAIVLARRLLSHDVAKLAEIEERFIATRPQCNPVVTLVSVSSKKLVPILMNPTGDDSGSWRTHAAIILANLTSPEAMEAVYDLGKALAKRDCNCAADFCFLAVAVLAGINPFKPVSATVAECDSHQYITLIHASIPDCDIESLRCRYGFSLADFHATEIFDYAIRLSDVNAYSPLGECIEYQRRRIQYAHLIADFGGFATDAFRYCMEVARAVWNYYHLLSDDELNDLCDLADKLRCGASASEWETLWIGNLRTMIKQKLQLQHSEPSQSISANVNQPPASQDSHPNSIDQYVSVNPETIGDSSGFSQRELSSTRRSQSESLADEARDWHAQRQDPLQMSSVAPHSSAPSARTEENESRSRTQSSTSQHGCDSDLHVMQASELRTSSTMPPHLGAYGQVSMDEPSSNSDDISAQSTMESTPIRTLNHRSEDLPLAQQPFPDFHNVSQVPMSVSSSYGSTTVQPHQPQAHSGQPISATQPNGLSDPNIKKSLPTHGSKGFFGNMKEKLMKAIPSGNEMILPDDSQPTIVWDPVKGRYVGAGVEEEAASAPPPKMSAPQSQSSFGGLRAARTSGGSRYFNPLNQMSSTNSAPPPQPVSPIPTMQVPTKFGFIPSMPDDSGESVDPFSGQANPTIHGVEVTQAAH